MKSKMEIVEKHTKNAEKQNKKTKKEMTMLSQNKIS